MEPATSRTSVCESAFGPVPTWITLPFANATSVRASSFCEGSITRPPRRIRSMVMQISNYPLQRRSTNIEVIVNAQDGARRCAKLPADEERCSMHMKASVITIGAIVLFASISGCEQQLGAIEPAVDLDGAGDRRAAG